MARPKEFNEAAALDSAIEYFRLRGYHATSVRDLATCMGIGGASVYNTFGDKRALFIRALERYLDHSVRARLRRLEESHPPKQVIPTFFREVIERSVSDRSRGGCLLINSALEISPHDSRLRTRIARYIGEIEEFFRRTIRAAQADGSVAKSLTANDMARLLLGILLGIRVLARSRPDQALLEGMVRPALGLLASPA
jgi:TetR/AcrR family transcriptional regulator, transcriptional repressor for nem operon